MVDLHDWKNFCNGRTVSLDDIMYNTLRKRTRTNALGALEWKGRWKRKSTKDRRAASFYLGIASRSGFRGECEGEWSNCAALGSGGAQVHRIPVRGRAEPTYIEL